MSRDVDPLRIATVVADMRRNPAYRFAALTNLLGHANIRDQSVVDHDVDEARIDESQRDIGSVFFVVADPVTAVNIDLDRRQSDCTWAEDVETFARCPIVRYVEHARERIAGVLTLFDPASAVGLQS